MKATKRTSVKRAVEAEERKAEFAEGDDKKPRAKRMATALTETARRRLVRTLIKQAVDKLEQEAGKTTMGDLIRLLNLEKEIGKERPTKITVQWIDPRTGKPWVNES